MHKFVRSFTLGATLALSLARPAFAARPGPHLKGTEVPCNPPCREGFTCRGGTCEPLASNDNAPATPSVENPKQPNPVPTEAGPAPAETVKPKGAPSMEPVPGDENFLPPWVHTSDFVDTRLSFLVANENLLANPGETTPNAPGTRIAGAGQTSSSTSSTTTSTPATPGSRRSPTWCSTRRATPTSTGCPPRRRWP